MTYTVVWNEAALNSTAGFLRDDAAGVISVFAAVDLLVDNPRPTALSGKAASWLLAGQVTLVKITERVTGIEPA